MSARRRRENFWDPDPEAGGEAAGELTSWAQILAEKIINSCYSREAQIRDVLRSFAHEYLLPSQPKSRGLTINSKIQNFA